MARRNVFRGGSLRHYGATIKRTHNRPAAIKCPGCGSDGGMVSLSGYCEPCNGAANDQSACDEYNAEHGTSYTVAGLIALLSSK